MLLILASVQDEAARWLADRWADRDARVVTPGDLSLAGWGHRLGAPDGTAVAGGRVVATADITGVLTRLPSVPADELLEIVPAERDYVAADMTAFLRAWLCGLDCPVLNAPTAACLAGPSWGPEQWTQAAARLGDPVRPVCRHATMGSATPDPAPGPGGVTVIVVGGRCFGAACEPLACRAVRLAAAAGTGLLAVRFGADTPDAEFWDADSWPDITAPDIADALVVRLGGGASC